MKIGYTRVSTQDQAPQLQIDALTAAGCERIFSDIASGARDDRPELTKLFDILRNGDEVIVWRLDRLGRSLKHLIQIVGDLKERGVGFLSLQEGFDTTTNGGRLVFHIFGALADFERELIRERTMAGLEAARARGRRGGRKEILNEQQVRTIRLMYASKEHSIAEIGRTFGVSRPTIYRYLNKQ